MPKVYAYTEDETATMLGNSAVQTYRVRPQPSVLAR